MPLKNNRFVCFFLNYEKVISKLHNFVGKIYHFSSLIFAISIEVLSNITCFCINTPFWHEFLVVFITERLNILC